MILIRLTSEDGLTGLGEAVPLSLRGGADSAAITTEIFTWATVQIDSPGFAVPLPATPPARWALLTALADIAGKRAGLPLHRLLAPDVDPVAIECNATLTSGPEVAAQAADWAADGFTTFKLKAGPDDALAQAEAVREALGNDARIRIDGNETWGDRAAEIAASLEPLDIELIEQPVPGHSMAALRAVTDIPLVADESVTSAEESREAARGGICDAVTVKFNKTGSLDPTLGGHLPTYLSSALDGPVGIAAAAHVGQALPRTGPWSAVAHGLATERLFASTIAEGPSLLEGSRLKAPSGNGLGIAVDESALEAHRL